MSCLLPGHKKQLLCWCWEGPLVSPLEPSREPEPSQSWWRGADWRGDWSLGTSCHDSAPQCKAPKLKKIAGWDAGWQQRSRQRGERLQVSHLIFLVVLNLVVQTQLNQVQHHAQHVLRHVLMIHPYLERDQTISFHRRTNKNLIVLQPAEWDDGLSWFILHGYWVKCSPYKGEWISQCAASCSATALWDLCNMGAEESSPYMVAMGCQCECQTVSNWWTSSSKKCGEETNQKSNYWK